MPPGEQYIRRIEKKISDISDRDFKPGLFSFEYFLVCLSCLYGWALRIRHYLFRTGILKQKSLPCRVVSIGNITAGGTGKTPMTVYVASLLKKRGKKVAVISRGYKGNQKGGSLIVSDGREIYCRDEECGDEPYMMACQKKFPVIVGKDRYTAGVTAVDKFDPDIIVLDDGFQHMRLKRDLDLVLFDYARPFGNKRLLPAGRLREMPEMSSVRADAVILTRTKDMAGSAAELQLNKIYPSRPVFKTAHRPYVSKYINGLCAGQKNQEHKDLPCLNGMMALLFSGLAVNRSFYDTVRRQGANILEHLEFKDHYRYKEADILMINKRADALEADIILTTEKDWVKLDPAEKWVKDLMVIGVEIEFNDPEAFEQFIFKSVG